VQRNGVGMVNIGSRELEKSSLRANIWEEISALKSKTAGSKKRCWEFMNEIGDPSMDTTEVFGRVIGSVAENFVNDPGIWPIFPKEGYTSLNIEPIDSAGTNPSVVE
jgi:hypothetical protein